LTYVEKLPFENLNDKKKLFSKYLAIESTHGVDLSANSAKIISRIKGELENFLKSGTQ